MTFLVAAALLAGLVLITLGIYFHSTLAPYRALLRSARTLGPTNYRGLRSGSNWLLVIEAQGGTHSATVPETALGLFLLREALADSPQGPSDTLITAVSPTLGLDIAQPWQFKYRRTLEMERRPVQTFSLSRAELLRLASNLLPADLAFYGRTAS
jgi:hypothetical protein